MNMFYPQQLGGVIADTAEVVGKVAKGVKKVVDKLKNLFGKKKDDQAMLAVRDTLDDLLHENGYSRPDRGGIASAPSFTAFKIKADQVSGKSPDYKYAYERLQNFLVAMFNAYKPGLGEQYRQFNPVTMKNSKEVSDQWIEKVATVIISNPVGKNAIADDSGTSVEQLANGYSILKDAFGKVLEIRNKVGFIVQPGTPEYETVAAQAAPPKQAGGTGLVLFGVVAALAVATYVAGKGDKKKAA